MPELPEVETVRRGLSQLLPGLQIASVEHNNPKSFPNDPGQVRQFVIGSSVTTVKRRAKVLLIELSTNYTLVTHLKMTGQLVFHGQSLHYGGGHPNASLVGHLPDASTRVVLTFSDGSKLFFNDQRKFGWMRLLPTTEVPSIDFMKRLGPEPLSDEFTWRVMKQRLWRRPNSMIKAVLLDQTVIAGVGNIYADESLWGAKIHPATAVKALSDTKIKRLHQSLRAVLELSLEKGGSTDSTYVDALGRKGSYLGFANVFRREHQACPRCGRMIIKTRIAGRGTHLCPFCQRLQTLTDRTE